MLIKVIKPLKSGVGWKYSASVGHQKRIHNFSRKFVRKVTYMLNIRPSVRPYGTGRIFMKFDISVFFENLSRNFKFQ